MAKDLAARSPHKSAQRLGQVGAKNLGRRVLGASGLPLSIGVLGLEQQTRWRHHTIVSQRCRNPGHVQGGHRQRLLAYSRQTRIGHCGLAGFGGDFQSGRYIQTPKPKGGLQALCAQVFAQVGQRFRTGSGNGLGQAQALRFMGAIQRTLADHHLLDRITHRRIQFGDLCL
jgi:hypothetical protein